jgi:predicted transcriptional regulator
VVCLNIALDDEYAWKLKRLADRTGVPPDMIARSLMCAALDQVEAESRHAVRALDAIPGALERAKLGSAQAAAGETLGIDELT